MFLKVYGATHETVDERVLYSLLAGPLGCEDKPTFQAFGPRNRPGRLAVLPRYFCRFGLLYLRKGNWGGKQLISQEHAAMAVASPLPSALPPTRGRAAQMLPDQRTLGSGRVPDDPCDHLGSYSFLWWTNGFDRIGMRHWRDAPPDTYGGFGRGRQRAMVVIPSLGIVLSWNDAEVKSREAESEALRLIVQAAGGKP